MIRVFLVVAIVLSITCNAYSSDKYKFIKKVVISEKSKEYADIQNFYIKNNLLEDNKITEIQKLKLSKNKNNYFVVLSGHCGSSGCGGHIIEQAENGYYKHVFTGREVYVLNSSTDDYNDIVEISQDGMNNIRYNQYKYLEYQYIPSEQIIYGLNSTLESSIKQNAKNISKQVYTYKQKDNDETLLQGYITGKINNVFKFNNNPSFKVLIIEDSDKDLLAMIVTNTGFNDLTSRFKDYKKTALRFNWRAVGEPTNNEMPRDIIMQVTNVLRK